MYIFKIKHDWICFPSASISVLGNFDVKKWYQIEGKALHNLDKGRDSKKFGKEKAFIGSS